MWSVTYNSLKRHKAKIISTHTLRVERDRHQIRFNANEIISTHTLRVERDTDPDNYMEVISEISTHTLRVERDKQ